MTTLTATETQTDARPYDRLMERMRRAHLLGSSASMLGWDQETMMPAGGLMHRARQLALLSKLRHEEATHPEIEELLEACEGDRILMRDPLSPEAVNVRQIRREFERDRRVPTSLVEELSRTTSIAKHEWAEARKNSDFSRFAPALEKILNLTKRRAACLGIPEGGEPWDALADLYEPGCRASDVEKVFTPLRKRLQTLLGELLASTTHPSNRFNETALPISQQEAFVRFVTEKIGFDFGRGRLDRSTHPFCNGTHPGDVRLTTRFTETCLNDALGSTMHEAGHGMYEQGLPMEYVGLPMGEAVSLGIHESQSRMWENQVGRSRAFWQWCMPHLKEFFGCAVDGFNLDELYGTANIVEPGYIRVEADEATYNMHVMVRFELERGLMNGSLSVKDLPGEWNRRYKDYLGLHVPDDRRGCLQDIHWSMGAIGYFPTYTLGNLYAAQFFDTARRTIPDLESQFARGDFSSLKHWLNTQIHAHGQRHMAADLCRVVTGQPLSPDHLITYLEGKLKPLYGL